MEKMDEGNVIEESNSNKEINSELAISRPEAADLAEFLTYPMYYRPKAEFLFPTYLIEVRKIYRTGNTTILTHHNKFN